MSEKKGHRVVGLWEEKERKDGVRFRGRNEIKKVFGQG